MKAFPKNSYDFLVADKEVFLLDKIEKGEKIMFSLFKKEKLEIRDSLYVTLTDHINSAVARYREGIALKNMMKLHLLQCISCLQN